MAEVHGGAAVDFAWYLKSASALPPMRDVEYETAFARHYAHVDCPGHADSCGKHDHWRGVMDAAIWLLTARRTNGSNAREQLHVRSAFLRWLVVYMNKVDRRRRGNSNSLEMEVRELLSKYDFDGDVTHR
jgi:translation elongation factor EF-Tu-like GTPase